MTHHPHNFPKLHNAAWPGVVGKEPGTDNPPIDLDTMLDYTADALVDGQKFDGVDLFLSDPHVSIDADDRELEILSERVRVRDLMIGSVVAPVWEGTGGGSAMDEGEGRKKFLEQVRKGCRIAKALRQIGIRQHGVVRIDSACSPADWAKDPRETPPKLQKPFGKPPTSPKSSANASRRKAKSAGEPCTVGGKC